MGTFKLPDLGEGLPDATIRQWYVKVGDTVKIDQPLLAVETAKAVVDIPAAFTGKITALKGNPNDVINVGDTVIEYEDETVTPKTDTSTTTNDTHSVVGNLNTQATITQESATGLQSQTPTSHDTIKAVPAARLIAREFDIDLNTISPSGKDQIITVDDVKKVLNLKKTSHETASLAITHDKLTPLTQAQRGLAQMMAKSHAEITPATLIDNADLHAWSTNADITIRLIQAVIAALKTEPILNAFYFHDQAAYKTNDNVNIGIAIDTSKGLYMPVIKDAAALSPTQLREQLDRFKEKSLDQTFSIEDLNGATIILSNYGSIVGHYATPTLVPPMVTIVGAGRIYRKVVAVDDQKIEIHRTLPLSITIDHRLITGGQVARFLQTLIKTLEKAEHQ